MKIASYNIASGGFDGYSYESKTPQRLKAIQEVVRKIDADIIGLIDTFRWNEEFSESDLKKLFGYEKVICIGLEDQRLIDKGHDNGITVLSRFPETRFETFRMETRNMVLSSIAGIEMAFVYLDDLSEDVRLGQTKKLLEKVDNSKKVVMLGDFNTFKKSEIPIVERNTVEFKKYNPKVYAAYADSITEMMRGEVVDIIEAQGFVDLGESCGMTFPTRLFPAKTSEPLIRLDHAFATNALECSNFRVHRGAIFDKASDHYPISVEVEQ